MKTLAAILALTLVLGLSALAVPQGRPNINCPMPGAKLGLSDQQRQQIRDIVRKFHTDAQALRKSELPADQKKAKLETLRTDAKKTVLAVLTPEQREKAEKSRWLDRLFRPMARRAGRLAWALKRLDLSEDQKNDIRGIMKTSGEQAKAIRQNQSLTPDQRKAQLQELWKSTKERIMSLLTPEQKQQLEDLLKRWPGKRPGHVGAGASHLTPSADESEFDF